MEMDPFDGMRKASSRLPQYFMKAILGWATAVATPIIEDLLNIPLPVYHDYQKV
jgi:hypothetical protein